MIYSYFIWHWTEQKLKDEIANLQLLIYDLVSWLHNFSYRLYKKI